MGGPGLTETGPGGKLLKAPRFPFPGGSTGDLGFDRVPGLYRSPKGHFPGYRGPGVSHFPRGPQISHYRTQGASLCEGGDSQRGFTHLLGALSQGPGPGPGPNTRGPRGPGTEKPIFGGSRAFWAPHRGFGENLWGVPRAPLLMWVSGVNRAGVSWGSRDWGILVEATQGVWRPFGGALLDWGPVVALFS